MKADEDRLAGLEAEEKRLGTMGPVGEQIAAAESTPNEIPHVPVRESYQDLSPTFQTPTSDSQMVAGVTGVSANTVVWGLPNKNTNACFLNAVLQTLAHTGPFVPCCIPRQNAGHLIPSRSRPTPYPKP